MLGSAEVLRVVMQQLRISLGQDNAAARRTHQVLSILEDALAETEPAELLAASRHVLEELDDHDH
jgi:hypothetical protein